MAKRSTRVVAISAMLIAVMLIIGYLENLVPTGVPGIKLGLSNSVLILAIYWFGIPIAFCLMIVKVVLSGLLFSGVSAMMYAFAGGVCSMIVMSVLYKMRNFSPVTIAMAGAVFHNVGQVGLAMIILETDKLLYYMAVLMLVGLATGFVTGNIARELLKRLPDFVPQEGKNNEANGS